jgi:hypothetical protein
MTFPEVTKRGVIHGGWGHPEGENTTNVDKYRKTKVIHRV